VTTVCITLCATLPFYCIPLLPFLVRVLQSPAVEFPIVTAEPVATAMPSIARKRDKGLDSGGGSSGISGNMALGVLIN
jgi:hypothetical protein